MNNVIAAKGNAWSIHTFIIQLQNQNKKLSTRVYTATLETDVCLCLPIVLNSIPYLNKPIIRHKMTMILGMKLSN